MTKKRTKCSAFQQAPGAAQPILPSRKRLSNQHTHKPSVATERPPASITRPSKGAALEAWQAAFLIAPETGGQL
ncbi:hypothetical protein LCGC14_2178530, partial [marine sediment metagenome]